MVIISSMPRPKKIPKVALKKAPALKDDSEDEDDLSHAPYPLATKRKVCDAAFTDDSDDEEQQGSDQSFVSCNQNQSLSSSSCINHVTSSTKSSPLVSHVAGKNSSVAGNDLVTDVKNLLILILDDMDENCAIFHSIASFKMSRAFYLTLKLPTGAKLRSVKQCHHDFVYCDEFKAHMNSTFDSYCLQKFLHLIVIAQNVGFITYPRVAPNVRFPYSVSQLTLSQLTLTPIT